MRIQPQIEEKKPIFVQGEDSKLGLIAGFKENKGSILMGTDSFWEGIDVSGLDLTLLIIDKLPFPVPDDPILKQKSRKGHTGPKKHATQT